MDYKALLVLYYSLILPYISYCTEVWGNTVSKKAVRIVHSVGYRDHTNTLFIKSKLLKLEDLVKLKTLLILYRARNNQLPSNIQKLFSNREGGYNLRGISNYKVQCVRTTLKSHCITRRGVNLWNGLDDDLKRATNVQQFKKLFKASILKNYEKEM